MKKQDWTTRRDAGPPASAIFVKNGPICDVVGYRRGPKGWDIINLSRCGKESDGPAWLSKGVPATCPDCLALRGASPGPSEAEIFGNIARPRG